MIRDPSDGSVRRRPDPLVIKGLIDEKPIPGAAASGLPIVKPDEAERLEESRNWLKNYVRPTING